MRIAGRIARLGLLLLASGILLSRGAAAQDPVAQDAEASLVPQTPHAGSVFTLAELKQPRLLASAGEDGLVRLWDTTTGRAVHMFRITAAQRSIRSLAAAHGKPWLALAVDSADATGEALVELWNVETSQRLRSFHGHPGPERGRSRPGT